MLLKPGVVPFSHICPVNFGNLSPILYKGLKQDGVSYPGDLDNHTEAVWEQGRDGATLMLLAFDIVGMASVDTAFRDRILAEGKDITEI
jgi:hypothetical protein